MVVRRISELAAGGFAATGRILRAVGTAATEAAKARRRPVKAARPWDPELQELAATERRRERRSRLDTVAPAELTDLTGIVQQSGPRWEE